MNETLGRGPVATADMKARIAALLNEDWRMEVLIERLWKRHIDAVTGDGYEYEYASDKPSDSTPIVS